MGGSSSLLPCNYSRKCQCGASVSIGFLAIREAWVGSPFRVREPRQGSDLVVLELGEDGGRPALEPSAHVLVKNPEGGVGGVGGGGEADGRV